MNSIRDALRKLVRGGVSAEEATEKVLAPYAGDDIYAYAHPTVLGEARTLERNAFRAVEKAAFSAGKHVKSRERITQLTFRLGDGSTVAWGEASVEQHEARIVWQMTQIAGIEADIARHRRAIELLREHDADRLDDIPGWQNLLVVDESSGAAA